MIEEYFLEDLLNYEIVLHAEFNPINALGNYCYYFLKVLSKGKFCEFEFY